MTRQTDTRYIHKRLQTFADVRHALDDLCHCLSNDINDATKVAEIEIVLAEILNNIVEHGGTSAHQYPVEISWDIGTEIAFMIRDTVQPLIYVPFFNRVSGAGGFMFRAWWGRM